MLRSEHIDGLRALIKRVELQIVECERVNDLVRAKFLRDGCDVWQRRIDRLIERKSEQ